MLDMLDDNVPLIEEMYKIDSYEMTDQVAIFELTALNVIAQRVPKRTIDRDLFPFVPRGRLFFR